MDKKKILEIGTEGGGLNFFRIKENGNTYYTSIRNEKYATPENLFLEFSKLGDPILWFYPVIVDPDIYSILIPILLDEYIKHDENYFMNLGAWEEILNIRFIELAKGIGYQTFIITTVEKRQRYSYNYFGDERVLDAIITDFTNRPELKQKVTGIGAIEGTSFVVRDKNSIIIGVFPVERYEVEVKH
jgi:hypothetical protein